MHDRLFRYSQDLAADYREYYSREYGSIEEYLAKRVGFDSRTCKRIAKQAARCPVVLYARLGLSFLDDDGSEKLLQRIVEPRGA